MKAKCRSRPELDNYVHFSDTADAVADSEFNYFQPSNSASPPDHTANSYGRNDHGHE